jgi:hypothetical protein
MCSKVTDSNLRRAVSRPESGSPKPGSLGRKAGTTKGDTSKSADFRSLESRSDDEVRIAMESSVLLRLM